MGRSGGNAAGMVCATTDDCEVDLLCRNQVCTPYCDYEDEEEPCLEPNRYECMEEAGLGVGTCRLRACDEETNPCTNGLPCHDGQCVECVLDRHCRETNDRMICDDNVCKQDCTNPPGCEDGYCNRDTGRCEEICIPACGRFEVCQNGYCVELDCNPACDSRQDCISGICVDRPDCRFDGCEYPLVCDQATFECVPPVCPQCEPGECCNENTDYQCGDCDACGPNNPDGSCPYGQECNAGACRDLACVGRNRACGMLSTTPGAPCCEGYLCCEAFPGSGGTCCANCLPDGTCAP